MALGVDKYNTDCREIVMRYSSEWRKTVERMGRWIDFDNDYKSLNLPLWRVSGGHSPSCSKRALSTGARKSCITRLAVPLPCQISKLN
jgi:hypothetical protein